MNSKSKVVEQMNEINMKIKDLRIEKCLLIEKELMYLKTRINTILTKFNKKYDPKIEKVIVMGKNELSLLYDANEFLVADTGMNLKLSGSGLISKVWNMTIYICDVESFLEIFGKADNVVFVDERYAAEQK